MSAKSANSLKTEWNLFWTAVTFFTRIPAPPGTTFSMEALNRSSRYFPLVGILVGGVAAAVFAFSRLFLPQSVSVLLSMAATILVTGAFHEDGFADVCDGFGGGWRREQVLEIMKDSRIGAFGAIGLVLLLTLKYASLAELPSGLVPAALAAGHAFSRLCSLSLIFCMRYVRENEDAKAKPLSTEITRGGFLVACLTGLLPCLLLPPGTWLAVVPPAAATWVLARYFRKRIGGYTGDCLGAAQQVSEVFFYLAVLGMTWSST